MIFFIYWGYILPMKSAKSMALLPYSKVPSYSDNYIPCLLSSGCFCFKWVFNCWTSLYDFSQKWIGHFNFLMMRVGSSYYFFILKIYINTVFLSYSFIYFIIFRIFSTYPCWAGVGIVSLILLWSYSISAPSSLVAGA